MRIQGAHLPAAGLAVLALAAATLGRPFDPAPLNAQGRASAIQSAGGGAGPLAAPDAKDPANAKADLSPRPPVRALTPDEQVEAVLAATRLPHRARPVGSGHRLARPGHLRRQRPHVRRRAARLRTDARRRGLDRADRPHLRARGSRRRRHVRAPHGVRRRSSFPALRHAVRRGCDP